MGIELSQVLLSWTPSSDLATGLYAQEYKMHTHTEYDCTNSAEQSSCKFSNSSMQIDIYISMNSQCYLC